MSASIYEVIVGPTGTVTSTLITEGTTQNQSCEQIVTLMRNLGNVTDHDVRCEDPTPVNLNLGL